MGKTGFVWEMGVAWGGVGGGGGEKGEIELVMDVQYGSKNTKNPILGILSAKRAVLQFRHDNNTELSLLPSQFTSVNVTLSPVSHLS